MCAIYTILVVVVVVTTIIILIIIITVKSPLPSLPSPLSQPHRPSLARSCFTLSSPQLPAGPRPIISLPLPRLPPRWLPLCAKLRLNGGSGPNPACSSSRQGPARVVQPWAFDVGSVRVLPTKPTPLVLSNCLLPDYMDLLLHPSPTEPPFVAALGTPPAALHLR